MIEVVRIALSLGLFLLWIAGLAHAATGWLTWVLLLAGVVGFGGSARFGESPRAGAAGWGTLSGVLLGLWIVALATGATGWLAWATFVFGLAYAVLAGRAALLQAHGSVWPWRTRSSN